MIGTRMVGFGNLGALPNCEGDLANARIDAYARAVGETGPGYKRVLADFCKFHPNHCGLRHADSKVPEPTSLPFGPEYAPGCDRNVCGLPSWCDMVKACELGLAAGGGGSSGGGTTGGKTAQQLLAEAQAEAERQAQNALDRFRNPGGGTSTDTNDYGAGAGAGETESFFTSTAGMLTIGGGVLALGLAAVLVKKKMRAQQQMNALMGLGDMGCCDGFGNCDC